MFTIRAMFITTGKGIRAKIIFSSTLHTIIKYHIIIL